MNYLLCCILLLLICYDAIVSKEVPQPADPFGFTEHERLYDRVSHERFQAFLSDEKTTIHHVELSANNYGEFLFVTMSRAEGEKGECITFWGLGQHEYRERWITKEWNWYQSQLYSKLSKQIVSKEEAQARIEERQQEIAPYAGKTQQSKRGALFEFLADLTDEDGAFTELEDLGDADGFDE